MKSKLLLAGKIGIAIGCVLLIIYIIGFGHNLIGVWQVEKIELTASTGDGTATVELKEDDVRQLVRCYNRSRYAGQITAEGCDCLFYVHIYLKDGGFIGISDHHNERIRIGGTEFESHWADNAALVDLIHNLVEDYGLLWETWYVC